MKTFISIIFALFLGLFACQADQNKNLKMQNIKYIGRFNLFEPNAPKCEWPGSVLSLRFKAKSISAVFNDSGSGKSNKFGGFDNNYILVIVDGKIIKKLRLKSGKHSYVLARNLLNVPHTITIYKCTEAFIGTLQIYGFELPENGEFLAPPPNKKRYIEFIGDSVTCAYGNEAKNEKEGFAPITENNFYSYAAITARKLNADFACIAWSGKGIYRNYDCSTNETILELYDKTLPLSSKEKYNFKEKIPQIVVINIGANDFAKPDLSSNEFIKSYIKLIKKVHNNYQKANIFLIATSKNTPWADEQFRLLKIIKKSVNIKNIHIVKLSPRDVKENGYGADWHPSVKSHKMIAEELVGNISRIMKWNTGISISKDGNKYWFKDGTNKFLARGVNCILPRDWGKGKKYYVLDKFNNNYKKWAKKAWKRLEKSGFNSAGAWCAEEIYQLEIPHTRALTLGGNHGSERLTDVFSKKYETNLFKAAEKQISPYKNEKGLIGFFANNELPFYGEFGWPTDPMKSLFDKYMKLPASSPGKQKLVNFIKNSYSNSESDFLNDWNIKINPDVHAPNIFTQLLSTKIILPKTLNAKRVKHNWAGKVADKYFSLSKKAIKKNAPDKLFLGSRFAFNAYESVFKACAKYVDVVSINYYKKDGKPDIKFFDNVYALTKKPIIITEFSFCAMENMSGNPNSKGADVTVQTQSERAEHYKTYCETIMQLPYVIGWDWFQYFDQPPGGRFDGENSNYGIFSINDKIYKKLSEAMKIENKKAEKIHKEISHPLPVTFNRKIWPELRPVTFDKPIGNYNLNWIDLSVKKIKIPVWGDEINGLKVLTQMINKNLVIDIDTGKGWGGGIDVPSNLKKKNVDKSINVKGAGRIIINAKIPNGMHFVVQLNESGSGEAGKQVYDGVMGADGESFTAVEMQGNGKFQDYIINFKLLELRDFFGNQRGNRNIDLQAIKSIAFYFPGNQGKKKIYIKNIKFE